MNKLHVEKRVAVARALVEGCSVRSTIRMTGVAKNTILKLLADLGAACAQYMHETMRNLSCRRLQLDEIWSFCGMKQKHIPEERRGEWGIGDVWTWIAIDADTKIVPSWLVGDRDLCFAKAFINDLASRLTHRVQVTTDGHNAYLEAMEGAFGGDVDYAMLIKLYGNEGSKQNPETRYSPGECCGTKTVIVSGDPDRAHVSTSFAERQNLTTRMRMRRFTRLTNGFSKKIQNLEAAVALHYMHYNFVAIHQTLRMPPALKAGAADHLWTIDEIVRLAG
jgi:IS1 family transposase